MALLEKTTSIKRINELDSLFSWRWPNKENRKSVSVFWGLALLFLCATNTASANTEKEGPRFQLGVGSGIQYAGIIGAQAGWIIGRHKLYFAGGVPAVGVGYNFAVSRKITLGVNFSYLSLILASSNFNTININYHFNAAFEKGWVIGVDYGRENSLNLVSGGSGTGDTLFISGGYRF